MLITKAADNEEDIKAITTIHWMVLDRSTWLIIDPLLTAQTGQETNPHEQYKDDDLYAELTVINRRIIHFRRYPCHR